MNIENMTSKELKEVAKELKVKNWWTLKKTELIAAIQDAQNEPEETEEVANDEVIAENEEAAQNESETSKEATKRNGWEKIAIENITNAYNWIVGENENTLQDYEEDSDEYKASYDYLYSGDEIMNDIYDEAITTKYGEGYCGGKAPIEMRFATKKFSMNLIRDLLKKDGYLKDEEKPNKKQDLIEYNGKTQNLSQWAKELNIPGQTLYARLRISNWSVEKAFTTPIKKRNKKTEEEA